MKVVINATTIAKVAHEVNKAYCDATGDTSQVSWEEAPQWQKDSAINGVLFHKNNPSVTPEESHNNWLAEKKAAGWKYGEIKNPDKKEHPCFLPFDELPEAQKAKDFIFKSIVTSLHSLEAEQYEAQRKAQILKEQNGKAAEGGGPLTA